MRARRSKRLGFTLIELMMVVAIIGLLAAIALPKFSDLVVRAKEAAVKGSLGSLRSAVVLYYADNEGVYFATGAPNVSLALVTGAKYLNEIPRPTIPVWNLRNAGNTNSSLYYDLPSTYYWTFYQDVVNGPMNGRVGINCTHQDSRGVLWTMS